LGEDIVEISLFDDVVFHWLGCPVVLELRQLDGGLGAGSGHFNARAQVQGRGVLGVVGIKVVLSHFVQLHFTRDRLPVHLACRPLVEEFGLLSDATQRKLRLVQAVVVAVFKL